MIPDDANTPRNIEENQSLFAQIEQLRKSLLHNTSSITITDFGAGSRVYKNNQRTIGQIARSAQKPSKFGQLLYRLVKFFQPQVIFDLGTSLGLTTLYQAHGNPQAQVFTFEGCPQTAAYAQKHFEQLQANNITLVIGNLNETLQNQIEQVPQIDFAFFDANHRYEPTIQYFEACLNKATASSLFVFDDIHWSSEMYQAWQYIKAHPKVFITIDLFFVGLVFFRNKQPKQHFTLKF